MQHRQGHVVGWHSAWRLIALACLAALLALSGCRSAAVAPHAAAELAALPYPEGEAVPYGEDLDIIVRSSGRWLTLTNREPRSFRNVQLWLNQQYVGRVGQIRVGADERLNRFPLAGFINEHRERFPVAGPLTPDKGLPMVLAEVYDPATGRKHRMLARWEHP